MCNPIFAYQAPHAAIEPILDGIGIDDAWNNAAWQSIDNFIIGNPTESTDFSGRFKIVWTAQRLYLLAEIQDDVLLDRNADPLEKYWEDDTIEILLDEDSSGGSHHNSYNAFAYHVSLDNQVVDIGEDGKPRLFTDHLESRWQRNSQNKGIITWEISLRVFADNFSDSTNTAQPVTLVNGKELGFMVAYCDADDPKQGRENFITSNDIPAVDGNKNRAYLDATVFGHLLLINK